MPAARDARRIVAELGLASRSLEESAKAPSLSLIQTEIVRAMFAEVESSGREVKRAA